MYLFVMFLCVCVNIYKYAVPFLSIVISQFIFYWRPFPLLFPVHLTFYQQQPSSYNFNSSLTISMLIYFWLCPWQCAFLSHPTCTHFTPSLLPTLTSLSNIYFLHFPFQLTFMTDHIIVIIIEMLSPTILSTCHPSSYTQELIHWCHLFFLFSPNCKSRMYLLTNLFSIQQEICSCPIMIHLLITCSKSISLNTTPYSVKGIFWFTWWLH